MSMYAGTIRVNDKTAPSGMITVTGTASNLTSDIRRVTVQEITTYEGTRLGFSTAPASLYLTANVSEYQKYSVQMELFDYAAGVLRDLATPTYEFSVDSANFLFAEEFAPFRDKLVLGSGVYLRIDERRAITPIIIEFELDFEDRERFSIVFSNRFKRHDTVNTLKDMIETSYSASRSLDASKYIYNQTVNQAALASKFMNDSLNAAVNTILGASNQSVVINGAGIQVGGDSKYKLRIVDSMIAMTDDDWQTAKLAIGRFASPEIGEYWGVNAEVIGGKLFVGNNLIIENVNDMGVMQFRVDATGAWLYNATFVLQSGGLARSAGGKILLDPNYGIVAGNGNIFTTSGTTVYPSFIDSSGNIVLDSDGLPENANFYLDIRDGSAYFRGTVNATAGKIGGWTLQDQYLYGGSGNSFVALNGSTSNAQSAYAIWAGATSPGSAPFWVKKNGEMKATSGTFSGTLSAARLSGNLTADANSWLIGCGINVGNGNFYVDPSGNLTLRGSINLSQGSIYWGANEPVTEDEVVDLIDEYGVKLPSYIQSTYIGRTEIRSPTITGDTISVYGSFQTIYTNKRYNQQFVSGYVGAAQGKDANDNTTYGVAMSNDYWTDSYGNFYLGDRYVIVTDAGVRLQSGTHRLTITDTGVWVDGVKIGTQTAVWG